MFEGKLVFAAGNFGDYNIFLYDLRSQQLTQLTSDDAWNDYPRFSPDASKIAFASTRGDKQGIWIMNVDGSDAKLVTDKLKWADFPAWSPDGKEIAFVSTEFFQEDIFALNVESGEIRRLTKNDGADFYPDWSPDGKSIAFSSERGTHQDIYILDLATLEEKRITTHAGPDTSPAFSPDGKKVAFVSQRPDQNKGFEFTRSFLDFFHGSDHLDIWTVDLDGGNLKQMTTNRGVDRNVRWSPDGKTLVYTSSSVDKADARIMFCDCDTDKITPLQFDASMVKRELERTFVADMNKPLPADLPPFQETGMGKLLEVTGEKMVSVAERMTPDKATNFLIKFGQKHQQKCEQVEIDRINTITTRHLDWK
jgi:Tol biopolymer transport system component